MDKMVSIIIPVYNAQKYMEETIKSIVVQDYVQKELILVDDGSTDSGGIICDRLAACHDWIRVFHIDNGGVGNARNIGVDQALGEYIMFVDADDRLEGTDSITRMMECAHSTKADIVCGSFRIFSEENTSDTNYHHLSEMQNTKCAEFRFRGYYQYGHLGFVWGKLYKKEFLTKHRLKMGSYIFLEDKLFNMQCSVCEPKYGFVDTSVYLYRTNPESVSFQYKADYADVWKGMAREAYCFLKQKDAVDSYDDMIAFHLFLGVFSLAKQEIAFQKKKVTSVWKALKKYASEDFVRSYFVAFAKGKYIKQIDSAAWRLVIQVVSFFIWIRAYYLLALGMTMLITSKLDQKIINRKYAKEEKN